MRADEWLLGPACQEPSFPCLQGAGWVRQRCPPSGACGLPLWPLTFCKFLVCLMMAANEDVTNAVHPLCEDAEY